MKEDNFKWILFSAFPAVAVAAQHLAVLGDGATAVAPRRDVVGLHLASTCRHATP